MNKKNLVVYGLILFFSFAFNNLLATDYYVLYNSTDATSNIQTGINSGADRVILSYQGAGTKWISGPLYLNSNVEFILETGVILEAKSGAFPSRFTPLITVDQKSNVKISGYGATIRMLINEYTDGEWRHCIRLTDSSNITIEGVTLEKSGGDGIYLGAPYNDTVLIQDVTCDGNARQGISIISAKNVVIDSCTLSNTGIYNPSGLATGGPWAGIDFEPNNSDESLENITVSNCTFVNNKLTGILFALYYMDSSSDEVSITINNCYISGGLYGIYFAIATDEPAVVGSLDIEECTIENPTVNGIAINNWDASSIDTSITNCTLINPTSSSANGAIQITSANDIEYVTGNFAFSNIYITESNSPYVLKLSGANQTYKIKDIAGSLYADHPDASIIYNNYYENINVSLSLYTTSFDTEFSGSADSIGGTDSEVFLTSSDAQVYPGDYNGDGKTDLFVKGYSTWRALYLANSTGDSFTREFLGSTGVAGGTTNGPEFTDAAAQVYPGDYNGDGKTDLFVKGYGTYRILYLANAAGNGFTEAFSGNADGVGGTTNGPELTDVAAQVYPGDYNGDGKTDLFVKGYGTYRILYLANAAGNGFTEAFSGNADGVGGTDNEVFLTSSDAQVYPGDYNGDGKTDLFVKGYSTWRALYLANSTGDSFTREFLGSTGVAGGTTNGPEFTDAAAQVYPGDYNGDGKTDLFVKGYETYRILYLANSAGNGFTEAFSGSADSIGGTDSEVFLTSSDAQVYPGDYNGDGKTDLFVKGYSTWRALYLANSTGNSFTREFIGNTNTAGGIVADPELTDAAAQVYPGDYNGDGKTDLFVKGYGTYRILYTAVGTYQQ